MISLTSSTTHVEYYRALYFGSQCELFTVERKTNWNCNKLFPSKSVRRKIRRVKKGRDRSVEIAASAFRFHEAQTMNDLAAKF